jgi:hypothetical protein
MDREWRRVIMMVVAVLLALGAVVAVASLNGGNSTDQLTNQQGSGSDSGSVSHVGGSGKLQYKVLP